MRYSNRQARNCVGQASFNFPTHSSAYYEISVYIRGVGFTDFLGFSMVICFPSMAPTAWGTFPLVIYFSSTLFHLSGLSGQCKYSSWNYGSADLEDKFADGGAANQPVILQGGVGLFSGQVSQGYCQFSPTSNGFLKLVTDFLMRWCMCSSMR